MKARYVGFSEYVKELLRTVQYKKDKQTQSVVAYVPLLLGCVTQGNDFEEARENIIDAIELWITVGLREGETMPVCNGVSLMIDKPLSHRSSSLQARKYA